MSILVMSQVWKHATDLSGNDLVVLLALADWGRDDGISWHSVPNLADKAHISERTVQRCLSTLNEMGYLRVEQRKDGKVFITSRYHIQLEHLVGGDKLTPGDGAGVGGGDNVDTRVVTELEGGGDNVVTLYVSNTKDKPKPSNPVTPVRVERVELDSLTGRVIIPTGTVNSTSDDPPFYFFGKKGNNAAGKSLAPDRVVATEAGLVWARERGWQGGLAELQIEAENCLDHHGAKGERMANWLLAVKKWVSNSAAWGHDVKLVQRTHGGQVPTNVQGGYNGHGSTKRSGYGYNSDGQPTNRATKILDASAELARRAHLRIQDELAGGDTGELGTPDRRGV